MGDVAEERITEHLVRVRAALRPRDTGRTAPRFVENLHQPQGSLGPDTVRAVDRVRAEVDPHGRFSGDIAKNATAR